jgi:AraC-like DNA-binding protein
VKQARQNKAKTDRTKPLSLWDTMGEVINVKNKFDEATCAEGVPKNVKNETFVSNALHYIDTAWKDALTLEKVAANAGFSISYFDRMFARATGRPVMEYVREVRLIHSAVALRNSDTSILDIALEYGYSNPENYTRAFKAKYGMPPSEYRRQHQDVSLSQKDASTGTVVNRFAMAFPNLKQVDLADFLDCLYATDPVKYAPYLYVAAQVGGAVFQLSDANEFVLVEEYRPQVVSMTLFCKAENIREYIGMARAFTAYSISVYCDINCEAPADKWGHADAKEHVQYAYAYLEDSVAVAARPGYYVRELTADDFVAIGRVAPHIDLPIAMVFEQKFVHGNFKDIQLFGLFCNDAELAGVALPSVEQSKYMYSADIGDIAVVPAHDNEGVVAFFWSWVMDAQLKAGALPTNSEAVTDGGLTNAAATAQMGYTLVGKRYRFTNE